MRVHEVSTRSQFFHISADLLLAYKTMPSLDYEMFTASGERGWIASWHKHAGNDSMEMVDDVYEEMLLDETRVFVSVDAPKGITRRWTVKLRGQLKPREKDCLFEFGLIVAGRAKVWSFLSFSPAWPNHRH